MFWVYILFSTRIQKTYVGFTSNLELRIASHNEFGKKDWTSKHRPWTLIHSEIFDSKTEAMAREKFLKSGKGRVWIKELLTSKNIDG